MPPTTTKSKRAREALDASPVLVSQKTCLAVLGIGPRQFLEDVVPLCGGWVLKIGQLRCVPVSVVLQQLATSAGSIAEKKPEVTSEEPETADGVLARLGLRRTA